MENDQYEVVIDPAANDRMYEHFEFLARVSITAVNNLLDKLSADTGSLERMPFRNPVYNRPYLPLNKYRYMLSSKRYRIVYQIDGSFVYIDDIQDVRQNNDKNLLP